MLRPYDRKAIEAVLSGNQTRAGRRTLRALLDRPDASKRLTRSDREEEFVALCDGAALPRAELNAPFTLPDGTEIEIDALWRSVGVAVELDSRKFHSTWAAQSGVVTRSSPSRGSSRSGSPRPT